MEKNNTISRRSYLKRALALAGSAFGALALQACGKSESQTSSDHAANHTHDRMEMKNSNTAVNCNDTSSLTDTQKQQRATVNYTKTSPMFGKQCDNCEHYAASKTKNCGTCHVVPGPIDAKGYCILYYPA